MSHGFHAQCCFNAGAKTAEVTGVEVSSLLGKKRMLCLQDFVSSLSKGQLQDVVTKAADL